MVFYSDTKKHQRNYKMMGFNYYDLLNILI